jgi:hypothetical protein
MSHGKGLLGVGGGEAEKCKKSVTRYLNDPKAFAKFHILVQFCKILSKKLVSSDF